MSAARMGLFPRCPLTASLTDLEEFRQHFLESLEAKPYRVRPASMKDMKVLLALEERCWDIPLRTPRGVLERRVSRYPQGQLVLTLDDKVGGIIYSQRIEDTKVLQGVSMAQVDALHRAQAPIVQLLAINIEPVCQQYNLGDQLLEFMLIYSALLEHVQGIVAITRCKQFDQANGITLEDYIHFRNDQNVLADPILRFHELHGANIVGPMWGYRPGDTKNLGCGVLVSYDTRQRVRRELQWEALSAEGEKPVRVSRSRICSQVCASISDALGEARKSVFATDRPLMEMGLDSADLLGLKEAISSHFKLALEPTFFFRCNTADKIIDYLNQHFGAALGEDTEESRPTSATRFGVGQMSRDDVAIVGMACRLPGGVDSPTAFWQCLQEGASLIGDLPVERWEWPDDIDPQRAHKGIARGGFIEDVKAFDAPFFRISPAEAQSMDPQQRMLLELCWQTIEHAGYAPDALAGTDTGVFIGASGSDYARLLERSESPLDAHYGTGSSMAVLANRLSYFYDFTGPSLLLDTACSSSLVAVHKAVQSIWAGESVQALVGGVNLILHPANSIAYYKAGMLAKDGLCKTFDQQADGYVRGEGAVMLLLKPLARALESRDRVYAVIKGTACNHGGQAGGLTVPNPERQSTLLCSAWQSAGIDPSDLGYIEAHGTGTSLGDPIEVRGLKDAFAATRCGAGQNCGLGSVKTNLGHLEAAAGIAGLLKVVLCLQHRQLPASLHFQQLNAHIELERGLYVVDRLQPWTPPSSGRVRFAGVSSFGSGGANAHVVVAEAPDIRVAPDGVADRRPSVFVLSAGTQAQLRAYAQIYIDWLSAKGQDNLPLTHLVYQLQTGRKAMAHRLALVVDSYEALLSGLKAFCTRSESQVADTPASTRREASRQYIHSLVEEGEWEQIAWLWQSGDDVDWSLLHDPRVPMPRVALPTYPFARQHYWLPESTMASSRQASVGKTELLMLAPCWKPLQLIDGSEQRLVTASASKRVLVVGGTDDEWDTLRALYADSWRIPIDPDVGVGELSSRLGELGELAQVMWIAPAAEGSNMTGQTLLCCQALGVRYLFKLIKALLAQSYGERPLGFTVLTRNTQSVFCGESPEPAHAGVHGFVGSLTKEYPHWTVLALDLDETFDTPVKTLPQLPVERRGECLAWRDGQWFERFFSPLEKYSPMTPAYRQGGVYVVIGGGGGIGAAWTRYVVERYAATVIWIGRRALDAGVEAQRQTLADLAGMVDYVQADASDPAALQAAYERIRQKYPAVHGVIQSATGVFDQSLAEMEEVRYQEILSSKIDISINLAQVFEVEPLDFMLFFSSIVALEKNGGLSGYATGGAFEDAFALHLAKRMSTVVKVVNWGYWAIGTGATISDAVKVRLQQSGGVPISSEEAMLALETILSLPLDQVALLKTSRLELLDWVDAGQQICIYPHIAAECIENIEPASSITDQVESLRALSLFNNPDMEVRLLPLLAGTLDSLGLLEGGDGQIGERAAGFYQKWLAASRRILATRGPSEPPRDLEALWKTWEETKRGGNLQHPQIAAAVALAEVCLRALPDILRGKVRAIDVLFPDASMERVQGIYRDNAVADYFNGMLADAVVAAVEARLRQEPEARLRLLEIGAGTGGSTALILPRIAAYQEHIAEYAYTDVSKAFLFHAEEHFVQSYPFVQPKLFDVEKPVADQAMETQWYDVAIATNVLHATHDIRQTLANTKATLRKHGLLLLNEVSTPSLFAHLTFGLLEGWWLTRDPSLRMLDAPGLYPQDWHRVLKQEGFAKVLFMAEQTHVLGQQVLVAQSDGVVRQPAPSCSVSDQQLLPSAPWLDVDEVVPVAVVGQTLKQASYVHLKKIVARILRMDSGELAVREPLETYGIDSILIVQITNALREVFPEIPSTLLFECQTLDALSDYLIREHQERLIALTGLRAPSAGLDQSGRSGERMVSSSISAPSSEQEAIAVIGMSGRFASAADLDEYWQLLAAGESCISEVPAERWAVEDFFHPDPDEAIVQGKSYSKWGGFLQGVTEFDPLFFNISPKEARSIDPQERLFLRASWEVLEDAGYTRERLTKDFQQQLGVFAGITRTGFDLFGPELWRQGYTVYPHTSFSSVANRVSYFLNARGPSVPVDTMCSSSLTAVHQACQSLRNGECRMAIAGGVNVYLHPSGYVGLSAAHMLSKDGVCRSFGKGANGFVPGEGVGAVLLKPLSQALADNDQIHAIIRSTQVNHGGKTNGYTVPNPLAQAELIRRALDKAGLNARAVSYVEAHGTGTDLGDPIEVSGLTQAFRHDIQENGFCALGSVKSNIGHLEAAAGIAGMIKVILQMRHGQLVPSLNAAEINPNIDFSRTPFVLQRELAPWTPPYTLGQNGEREEGTRIAGVSSFGAGGGNAHVILEEYRRPQLVAAEQPEPECLVVLSARSEERLRAYLEKLHEFVAKRIEENTAPALADLAYTLQVGREPMEFRLGLVARSISYLQNRLWSCLQGTGETQDVYRGQVKQHKELIEAFSSDPAIQQSLDAWFDQRQYDKLLDYWSKGLNIDWEKLYSTQATRHPHRISLPTYPFAATRYWLPSPSLPREVPVSAEPALPAVDSVPPITAPASSTHVVVLRAPGSVEAPPSEAGLEVRHVSLKPLSLVEGEAVVNDEEGTQTDLSLSLQDEGDGIVSLKLAGLKAASISLVGACTALTRCIRRIHRLVKDKKPAEQAGVVPRVLLLTGLGELFALREDGQGKPAVTAVVEAIADIPIPVLVVLEGDNSFNAMIVATSSDLMILSEEGAYHFASPSMSEREHCLFVERFGLRSTEELLRAEVLAGRSLNSVGIKAVIVERDRLFEYAVQTARHIAQASATALSELKRHWSTTSIQRIEAFEPRLDHGFVFTPGDSSEVPEPVPFNSEVARLSRYRNGVLLMTLCERQSKNTFSRIFVEGVIGAFEHISGNPSYKVVVLTGYDNYFACGGTKQGLLDIQSGKARFTDEQSYRMPLSCDIPVIAAMQGHAIGAGWAMGLFCDCSVYSEESIYQSPYMRYDFTPGAGSTLIFPLRLGHDLSREVLLTAREFHGRELRRRGIDMPVLPRRQVLAYALSLAAHLAITSRQQLVEQKNRRVQPVRELLPRFFEQELAMHEKTFVGNQQVIEKLNRHFYDTLHEQENAPMPAHNDAQTTEAAVRDPEQKVYAVIRDSLAEELQMDGADIDPDTAFVEMGLDSIVAVTWVRKLNKAFGLSIGATKVYSYPDLTQFARFVAQQLPELPSEAPISKVVTVKNEVIAGKAKADGAGDVDRELLAWLKSSLSTELLLEDQPLDEEARFVDVGLDSITAVTWIKAINQRYGLSIGATKVYSYSCLAEFSQYVRSLIAAAQPAAVASRAPAESDRAESLLLRRFEPDVTNQPREEQEEASTQDEPIVRLLPCAPPVRQPTDIPAIAIIGMSGQFPQAPDVKAFWRNIVEGRDCVSEIPAERWSIEEYYDSDRNADGKTVCRRMGALSDREVFDPLFFNISPSEAELMDPQQRLFLLNSWHCIEDAGYDPTRLSGSLCGIFVGCAASDYSQLAESQTQTAQGLLGESVAMLPARVAYYLNLQGPCLAIDTACSASLVALASACDSLVLGNSDVALAGGVYVINGPDIQVKMSKAGMLSPDGRCFSFDQRGNGFVPGEGVGVLMLKRLEQAQRDGDDIYAVIRGWGVNQDGKTNGITAPNQESQTRLETGIYRKFGINPEHIQLVEAHGTATRLGDPIEVEALSESFRRFSDRKQYCALGSVKSNIGHLATAAGVTSVIKSALALQHRILPPTINFQTLNEHIRLQDSPFYINTERRLWEMPQGHSRQVAVSSFGFSGTNAHMVLEEPEPRAFVEDDTGVPDGDAILLPLSARSEEQLSRYAQAVCDYLADEGRAVRLVDIALTYQQGRTALPCRLAVIAHSVEELHARLAGYVSACASDPFCLTGWTSSQKVSCAQACRAGTGVPALLALAKAWVEGASVDWPVPTGTQARRLHGLPVYPFARERYWIAAPANLKRSGGNTLQRLHDADDVRALIASGSWWEKALPDEIDWKECLHRHSDRQVLVLYGELDQFLAFQRLLQQLQQAGDIECIAHVSCVGVADDEIEMKIKAQPDMVLLLSEDIQTLKRGLEVIERLDDANLEHIVFFVSADSLDIDELVAPIEQAGLSEHKHCHVISYQLGSDRNAAAQCLFREWLNIEVSAGSFASLVRVHYVGDQRLVSAEPVMAVTTDPIYQIHKKWHAKPLSASAPAGVRGAVLLMVNRESLQIVRNMFAPDDFSELILLGDASIQSNQIQNAINFSDARSATASAHILLERYSGLSHVIDLMDFYETAKGHDDDKQGKVAFYQVLIGACIDLSILYCTKGLQPFQNDRPSLAGAKFAGLIKMLSADYRHVKACSLDVDEAAYKRPWQLREMILREFAAPLRETEVCYRDGQRFVPVLSSQYLTQRVAVPLRLSRDGVYVISGGTNGVGLEIAGYLLSKGCTKLVLMGVKALPPRRKWAQVLGEKEVSGYIRDKLTRLLELEKMVDVLRVYTGSLSNAHALQHYFKKIRAELGPIKGVIHSAGVYSDPHTPGFVNKNLERMRHVWEPKVNGLETLSEVFKSDTLEFFVSFSSVTGVLPRLARGASDYAMANAFVDFFMQYQARSSNLCYKTILWSDWEQTGAITRLSNEKAAAIKENFRNLGIRTFTNQEGCELFERAMACVGEAWVFIGLLDPERFEQSRPHLLYAQLEAKERDSDTPSLAEELRAVVQANPTIEEYIEQWEAQVRAGQKLSSDTITEVISMDEIKRLEPELIQRIHELLVVGHDAASSSSGIAQVIVNTVMEVLKLKKLDPTQPFQNYGLDSISAMVLATRLEKRLNQQVQPQWLIDFASVEALSAHLLSQSRRRTGDRSAMQETAQ
uniref:Putative type I polyketide synthase n=1 Tax=symbiont bacterium of Paederus fuscipes TaxID=176282 RepID=Q6TAB6_UNCXX|nr:putative type I polyketide synthase [symbiont bacterium of Paederus fuscipes]